MTATPTTMSAPVATSAPACSAAGPVPNGLDYQVKPSRWPRLIESTIVLRSSLRQSFTPSAAKPGIVVQIGHASLEQVFGSVG